MEVRQYVGAGVQTLVPSVITTRRESILALARTLSRTPASELVPGGEAYMPLLMLRCTLDVLIPTD